MPAKDNDPNYKTLPGNKWDKKPNVKSQVHKIGYPGNPTPIKDVLKKSGAGIHVKTAGTTWLEEVIGLAKSEGKGLVMAKKIYEKALDAFYELCAPYATVINIELSRLPSLETVNNWRGT